MSYQHLCLHITNTPDGDRLAIELAASPDDARDIELGPFIETVQRCSPQAKTALLRQWEDRLRQLGQSYDLHVLVSEFVTRLREQEEPDPRVPPSSDQV